MLIKRQIRDGFRTIKRTSEDLCPEISRPGVDWCSMGFAVRLCFRMAVLTWICYVTFEFGFNGGHGICGVCCFSKSALSLAHDFLSVRFQTRIS